ncbi:hypothetical protein GCM10020001_036380 [Nonomuraea salmonea]
MRKLEHLWRRAAARVTFGTADRGGEHERKARGTLRAQWLGKQLRDLRERAGLTLKEAGEYVQRDGSTVSRFEAGLYPARTPGVLALLDLYGVTTPQERDGLVRLSRDVWQNGWWDDYSGDVSHGIVDYGWLEARAERITSFDALVIPGLLQTEAYMEAVIRAEDPDATDEQVSRWIDFRRPRQQILPDSPPLLHRSGRVRPETSDRHPPPPCTTSSLTSPTAPPHHRPPRHPSGRRRPRQPGRLLPHLPAPAAVPAGGVRPDPGRCDLRRGRGSRPAQAQIRPSTA